MGFTATGLLVTRLAGGISFTVAFLGVITSTIFLLLVLAAAWRFRVRARATRRFSSTVPMSDLPRVAILKPVHGMEPELADNLESFFQQDYPDFEILIGARDPDNAALAVARQVCGRHPEVKSRIVISGPPQWPNAKVFSLAKMIAASQADYFVISDSDVRVSSDFLRQVIVPLLDPEVGLVTCPYRGIPAGDFWSSLEALGMSVEMPSGVMVADMLEGMRFAMGAVMVVRRDALVKIGGIATTANYYSDDFVLGNRVWAAGYKVTLSHYVAEHVLMPRSCRQTFGDQLRWMKSTRYSRPWGHVGNGLTFALPYGILGLIAGITSGHLRWGVGLLLVSLTNRILQAIFVGWGVVRDRRALRYCWLYPLRDLLGFCTWTGSFTSRSFFWRGETYRFGNEGRITPQRRTAVVAAGDPL